PAVPSLEPLLPRFSSEMLGRRTSASTAPPSRTSRCKRRCGTGSPRMAARSPTACATKNGDRPRFSGNRGQTLGQTPILAKSGPARFSGCRSGGDTSDRAVERGVELLRALLREESFGQRAREAGDDTVIAGELFV